MTARSEDEYLISTIKHIVLDDNAPQDLKENASVTVFALLLSGVFLIAGAFHALVSTWFNAAVAIPFVVLFATQTPLKRAAWRATTPTNKLCWRATEEIVAAGSAFVMAVASGSLVVGSFFVTAWICEWYARLSFRRIVS